MAAVLEDFRRLEVYSGNKRRTVRRSRQDKGHDGAIGAFLEAAAERGVPPIPLRSLALTTLVTFAVEDSLRSGEPGRLKG